MIEFKSYHTGAIPLVNDSESVKSAIYSGVSEIGQMNSNAGFMAFHVRYGDNAGHEMKERLRIEKNGNVGIGITKPVSCLDVRKDITLTNDIKHLQSQFSIGNATLESGYVGMTYRARGIYVGDVDADPPENNSGIVYAATYCSSGTGNFGTETLYFGIAVTNVAQDGEKYGVTDNVLTSLTHLAITNEGKVGIGTTNPAHALDVNGNMRINNKLLIGDSNDNISIGESSGGPQEGDTLARCNTYLGKNVGNKSKYNSHGENFNVGIGYDALENVSNARANVAVGHKALNNISSTGGNTAIGQGAGKDVSNCSNCTFLGRFTDFHTSVSNENFQYSTAIGWKSKITKERQIVLGAADADFGNKPDVYIPGKLGIGTTSPSYTLDVSGTINCSGNITVTGSNLLSTSGGTISGELDIQSDTSTNTIHSQKVLRLGRGTDQQIFFGINLGNGNYNDRTNTNDHGMFWANKDWGATPAVTTTNNFIIAPWGTDKKGITIYGAGGVASTSFNADSDYRLKENVQTISGDLYTVDNLRPVSYVLKESQEPHIGFIAHELQEHVPTAVKGEKDGEVMQSVNYSELIPILVKEIQDLKQEVRSLKQQVHELSH